MMRMRFGLGLWIVSGLAGIAGMAVRATPLIQALTNQRQPLSLQGVKI